MSRVVSDMPAPRLDPEEARFRRRRRSRALIAESVEKPERDRLTIAAIGLFAVVLVVTPFMIGAVHLWAIGIVESAVWVLGWLTLAACHRRPRLASDPLGARRWRRAGRAFAFFGACLGSYLVFQLMPIPANLLGLLSPETLELRSRTVGTVFGGTMVEWAPIALHPFHARVDLARYLAYAVVLAVAATIPRPRWIFRALAFGGFATAAIGIAQNLTWNGKILWVFESFDHLTYYPRMSGPYVNADHFAALLELTLFAAAAEFVTSSRGVRVREGKSRSGLWAMLLPAGWLIALAVMSAGVIGSASRGGLVGMLLGLVVFCAPMLSSERQSAARMKRWARRRRNRFDRLAAVARAAVPAIAAAVIVLGGLAYVGAESRRILDLRLGRSIVAPDLDIRIHHWQQTLPMIADFPLLGVGLRGWREVFQRYERFPVLGKRPNHAHNDYLEWLAEVGAVGFVLTALCVVAYASWVRSNPEVPRWVRRAIAASIVALCWHEFFDFNLRVSANAIVLATLLGLRVNPRWGETSIAGKDAEPASPSRHALAALVVLGLTVWSVLQVREFIDWRRAANGIALFSAAPSYPATWAELGRRALDAGDRDETVAAARQALERRFLDGDAYWRLALAAEDDTLKLRALEAALIAEPPNSSWRLAYATELERTGRTGAARREVVEAFRRDPRPYVYRALSPANAALRGPLRAAIEEGLRSAIRESGEDPDLLSQVAWFYYRPFERWPEAAESWVRAAETSGDWNAYAAAAIEALARARQFERAESIAATSLAAAPENGEIYRMLALEVHLPNKRFDEAAEVLELGLRRAGQRELLFYALAHVQTERGELAKAVETLERGVRQYQRNARLRTALGLAHSRLEDFTRAKLAFEEAAELEPRMALHAYFAGVAAERLYSLDEARRFYARAITIEPGNATFREALARVQSAFDEEP